MVSKSCDGCGRRITVTGSSPNVWTFSDRRRGGLTLEFDDGTSQLLCFSCLESLPEEPTASDFEELPEG